MPGQRVHDPALAHIRRTWPGAHRVDHQRRVRVARRHTGPAVTSTRARPAPGPAGQFRITRGAGSSDALNRQCGTTGADTRAAFVDSASRHPRHPNTNSLLSNSNPLLSQSQSTTIPLPSHYHPLPVRFCPPPDTYYVRTGVFHRASAHTCPLAGAGCLCGGARP